MTLDDSLSPERAYRLLLGLAGDLESMITPVSSGLGATWDDQAMRVAIDPVTVAGHLAMVARLLADEIGRRLDAGFGHE